MICLARAVAPLALAVLLLSLRSPAEPIQIPITRKTNRLRTPDDHFAAAEMSRRRYGFGKGPDILLGRRSGIVESFDLLDEAIHFQYSCTVVIGTPGRSFNLLLDTGSPDMWVADILCSSGCGSMPSYNPSQSSTFFQASTALASITYSGGIVYGGVVQDTVHMGKYTVLNQPFLAVTQISNLVIDGPVSGIMGLAFLSASPLNVTPFWQTLSSGGQLLSGEMGFWFKRFGGNPNAQYEEPGGDIDFLNAAGSLVQPTYWMLSVSAITVQGKPVTITGGAAALAVIDTGAALIGGPTPDIIAFWADVPGSSPVPSLSGFYQFPCSTTLKVSVSFGGKTWPINPADMNIGPVTSGSSQCLGALYELNPRSPVNTNGSPNWVFGIAFLKNVYFILRQDPLSIGFAQLSDVALGSDSESSAFGNSSPLPLGPIVGSVAGFFVLSLIGALTFCFCRRKRRKDARKSEIHNPPVIERRNFPVPVVVDQQPNISSFILPPPTPTTPHYGEAYTVPDTFLQIPKGLQLSPGVRPSCKRSRPFLPAERSAPLT
ncbi:aspartic peptidase domain-containing protein [Mycena sp. CBHHK59/15]|nr:aspartic peptidase domain-containing protein [Mycena sp. CBHHK59/15]